MPIPTTPEAPSVDARDAARYRWWRQYAVQTDDCSHDDAFMECETPEQLDALIDAALGVDVPGEGQPSERSDG